MRKYWSFCDYADWVCLFSRDYSYVYAGLSMVVRKGLGADRAANVQMIESVVANEETMQQSQPNLEISDATR